MTRSDSQRTAKGTRRPFRSPLILRLALLVAAPILFFCALELSLRVIGFGRPTGFFISDREPGYYQTNPDFLDPFIPASFGIQPLHFRIKKHKEQNSFRVFVLGESAAQGLPAHDLGFAAQLRAQLHKRYPNKDVRIYNLGITAIDSHVVYRIAEEAIGFEPDLLVIYMGNNEVVGPYGPGCFYRSVMPPLQLIRASVWIRATRTGQMLVELYSKLAPGKLRSGEWNGMETFTGDLVRGDDPRLEAMYSNFAANLRDTIDLAGRHNIKSVLATVVANLKDCAPFVSEHRQGMSSEDMVAWEAKNTAGKRAWNLGETKEAFAEFGAASRIDPQYAETHFRLGKLSETLGDSKEARKQYADALHWDALRFRPEARLNEIIRHEAQDNNSWVILVDSARFLGSDPESLVPLAGREILFDHVHFNWTGNYRMAELLAKGCVRGIAGEGTGAEDGLDSAACARVLGFTPFAQLEMVQVITQLTLKAPFTNQFTFSEDQARLKKAAELASSQLSVPQMRSDSLEIARDAFKNDPANAFLAVRLASMESVAGEPLRSLTLYDRAESLEPPSPEWARSKASILISLHRFSEAEASLLRAMGTTDRQYASILGKYGNTNDRSVQIAGPALFDLWTETGQLEKGRRFFVAALSRAPGNKFLRLEYASFLIRSSDREGAEREGKRIWTEDPDSRTGMAALELLVQLYQKTGRPDSAVALTLEAERHQEDDYYNVERLVDIYLRENKPAKVVQCLQSLASIRPFDSSEHLDLAQKLADLNRGTEMLDELAKARDVALIEGGEPQIQATKELIDLYKQRFEIRTVP